MPLNFVAKAAITVALTAANMALTMSRKIEGPRLDNLKFTGGDYGSPLPMVWGMRRIEVPIFWAEDLREVKRRRKTKGGKFNEYTYYGTWAVALAGHEIDAVRRIWFDTHLVYDLSGVGPVTPFDFGATGTDISETIAIYLGTSTQDPDPRMQATVEAEFGEGSCPAYRDTAYVCFKDIPLEKLGNRIPQVSVEIVSNATAVWPTEERDIESGGSELHFSPDFTTLYAGGYYGMTVLDTASRAIISDMPGDYLGLENRHVAWEDGSWLASVGGTNDYYVKSVFGTSELLSSAGSYRWLSSARDGTGQWHWANYEGSIWVDGDEKDWSGNAPALFADLDGDLWIITQESSNSVTFRQLVAGVAVQAFSVTGLTAGELLGTALHYRDETTDRFIFDFDVAIYAVDTTDGEVLGTYTGTYGTPEFRSVQPGAETFWAGFREIRSADLSLVRYLQPSIYWGSGLGTEPSLYDPINHALVTFGSTGPKWWYLDRIGSDGVTLETICNDVADMCGVEAYDFSDLDQTITGWSTTRGQASNMLEPLLDTYDSDIRPHDFGIEGIKRTGITSGSAIATAWLVGEPRYSVTVKQELPRALLIDFADVDADQQPNTARADRPLDATDARGELKIDLTTLALEADEAIQLANRHFRRRWNERKEITTGLTAKELKLEPGDVRSITLDGDTDLYRCTSLTVKADDTLATEWRYDHPSLATLDGSSGAAFDGRDPSVVVVPLLSRGFVLDIPLLTDSDASTPPTVYPLAGPVADGAWPGATTFQEVDGEYTDELASIASSDAVTWGTVSTAMPYANPNLWDRGTSITVTLKTGTLTGCTEAAANADPTLNLAVIGDNGRWEIVQFTNAALTAPLTYTVSGFKRGRRGTEWAMELHEAGESFVLVEDADTAAMGLSEVGTDISFKPITSGRTTGFAFGYEFQGQSLMPYAPVHLEAEKDAGTGDWTFTWVRRTRIGGAWTSGSTIPLSEASEEYELTLGDGVTDVVKSPTSPTYTWTVAEQTTDTGAEVMEGDLVWTVAQVSDAVGAGFLAAA